jgi:hypothetical protein
MHKFKFWQKEVLQVRTIYIYTLIATWLLPYKSLGLCVLSTNLNKSNVCWKLVCLANFYPKNIFKSCCSCKNKPTALILAVAELPELFRLKCTSYRYTADTNSMHFKRNNPLVCRVSARCNHGSTRSKQVYLARRRVHNHIQLTNF